MADEIGEALQRVASASENSNISLEKSASWLATISSITRESSSTIGRSLNSVISRYESIKKTGFNSEDATKINDVVEALSQVGIVATDSQGQLRDFAEVMDTVGAKFSTLDKNEKAYIATTLFGTYQRNRGLTLLNNYQDSLKNYENALNSAGTTEQKFAIYQESTNARLDRARSSIEGFWQNAINSDTIKLAIDGFSGLIDILDILINNSLTSGIIKIALFSASIYGLGLGIGKLSTIIAGSNFGLKFVAMIEMMASSTLGLSVGIKALTATMLASPLFWVVAGTTAIYAIVEAVDYFTVSLSEQKEVVSQLTSDLQSLNSEYDKLKSAGNRTEEQEKYLKLLEKEIQLKKDDQLRETKKLVNVEFIETKEIGGKESSRTTSGAIEIQKSIDELKRLKAELSNIKPEEGATVAYNELNTKIGDIEQSLIKSRKTIKDYIDTLGSEAPVELKNLANSIDNIILKTDDVTTATNNNTEANYRNRTSYEELNKTFESSTNNLIAYNDMIQELEKNHKLSAENVNKIFKDYPQLLAYLGDEKALHEQLIKLKEEEANKQRETYIQMIQDSEEFYNLRIKGNVELTNEIKDKYDIDLQNFKTLAEAKEKIESTLLNSLSKKWGTYFDATRNALTTDYTELMRVDPEMAKQVYGDVVKYFRTGSEFNDIVGKFVSSDFNALNLSKTGSGSKKDTNLSDILPKEQEYQNKILDAENKSKNLLNEEYDARLKNLDLEKQANEELLKYYESQHATAKAKGLEDELNEKILKTQGDLANIEKERKDINKDIAEAAKKQAEEQIKLQQEQLKNQQELLKQREEAINDLIKLTEKMIKQQKEDEIDALEDQLKKYKDIIDAKKEALRLTEEQHDYEKGLAEKQKDISKIQDRLLELELDDSREAQAEKLQLQEDLAEKTSDLEEYQHDRSIELTEQALDKEYELFEDKTEKDIQNIKDFLDKSGALTAEAMRQINENGDVLKNQLIEWNADYGTSIEQNIVTAWSKAQEALQAYKSELGSIDVESALNKIDEEEVIAQMKANSLAWMTADAEERQRLHNENKKLGKSIGAIYKDDGHWYKGGVKLYGKGTYVDKPELAVVGDKPEFIIPKKNIMDFVNKVNMSMPQMNIPQFTMPKFTPTNNSMGNIQIDSLLTVNGSVTKDSLPELNTLVNSAVDKLVDRLGMRGINRNAKTFSV